MDVLCVGMYRACSTWQYEIASQLVERHQRGRRLGYLTGEEYAALSRSDPNPSGWRVLKSHEEHPEFARALREGRAIAIYAFRDLRDVVYSMLHKRGLDFETFLRQGMIHQILANDRFWSRQPRQFTQRYERITADPIQAIEELADHLGISLDPGEADQLAADNSLEANRRRTQSMAAQLQAQGLDLNDPANAQWADQQTLLHWNHVRSGRSGDWREQAKPSDRRLLHRIGGRWLAQHGYEPDKPPAPAAGLGPRLREQTALARGWLACRLRCASLRYPRLSRAIKRLLGIPEAPAPHRSPTAIPTPHHSRRTQRSL